MLQSLRQALKTLSVDPPTRLSLKLSRLPAYITESGYTWETKEDDGVVRYLGTLDCGFGRSYNIEWKPATAELKLSNAKSFELLGVSSKRNAVMQMTVDNAAIARDITKSITDSVSSGQ